MSAQLLGTRIARAIAKRPEVLLCDEPTGALDYATGKLVLEALAVNQELGTTTAVITHNAGIAAMADRVVRLFASNTTNTRLRQRSWSGDRPNRDRPSGLK
jgi:putative ABC transport system ATP-binding protein